MIGHLPDPDRAMEELQERVAELEAQNTSLKKDLVSLQNTQLYKAQNTRGITLGALETAYQWLLTAQYAAAATPPRIEVVQERLCWATSKVVIEKDRLQESI